MADTTKHEFDYVIVGAGPSAIGLLLGLVEPFLKENSESLPFSIAIVERGPEQIPKNDRATRNLNQWFEGSHDRSSPHVSLSTTLLRNRKVDVPVGRGIGGGSNINAGLCVPPLDEDFQEWPEPWKTYLPLSVRHLQNKLAANHCLWNAATGAELQPQEARVDSLGEVVPCLARRNLNDENTLPFQRVTYWEALIEPLGIQDHPRIQRFCTTEAQRLLFRGDTTVTGVEVCTKDGPFQSIHAKKEVILCAGAIETPALLLVSGISGSHGGVGHKLRDHLLVPRVFWGPPPCLSTTLNGVHRLASFEAQGDRLMLLTATTEPLVAFHFFARIFQQYTNWMPRLLWTVLETLLRCLVLYTPIFFVLKHGLTTNNLALANPNLSTGQVSLKPKECVATTGTRRRKDFDVDIDLGYLNNLQDIDALWRGWAASPAVLSPPNSSELFPGFLVQTLHNLLVKNTANNLWFSTYARATCVPFFHWCGTCAMKTTEANEEDWVVDALGRVRNLHSLRICDASIFPYNLSVPPALTCAAIGHLMASRILLRMDEQSATTVKS